LVDFPPPPVPIEKENSPGVTVSGGFTEDEIADLIKAQPAIATQLNETTKINTTDWAKRASWKNLYELGLNPNPNSVNSVND